MKSLRHARSYTYCSDGERKLRIHAFQPPRPLRRAGGPGILFFHGGGFRNGHPSELAAYARHFASCGYVAAVAEYGLVRSPSATVQDCIEDAIRAYRYFRTHIAREMKFDAKQIAVVGASAGGHLAFWIGHRLAQSGHGPAAVILISAVVDTTEEGFGREMPGGASRALSPLHNVIPGLPPALILHGELDETIPASRARGFAAELERASGSAELTVLPGRAHGFYVEPAAMQPDSETLRAMTAFLQKHLSR